MTPGIAQLSFIQADLSEVKSVRLLAKELPAETLDILIMTQGIFYKHNFVKADMNNPIQIRKYVEGILQTCRLAVLATEAHGQPHASLIAITPVHGFRQIIFATYHNTRKFESILHNGKIAVLIQGEDMTSSNPQKGFALTAFGHAREVGISEWEEAVHTHLERHPDLESILHSVDFAIIRIKVDAYQVVRGINDVIWWPVVDSEY